MAVTDHDVADQDVTDQARSRAYRDAYDRQIRARIAPGDDREQDLVGPVVRRTGSEGRGFLNYRDLGGLDGAALDAFIVEQRDHFTALGRDVEWKYHGHDLPLDLPDRLRRAGFVPEDEETVMVGEAADLATAPESPDQVRLRAVTDRADLERIRVMQEAVWQADCSWLPDRLEREIAGPGDPCVVVVAEAGDEVVSAAWARFHDGTEFVSLWGGSTLAAWRGRGIYRALVAHRAQLAAERGFRYVQVDASADSRPILTRLGLLPATTTTPYIWTPGPDSR